MSTAEREAGTPEFDVGDVRRYYDRNTGNFVAHGEGGASGALHRAVWGPGVDDADAAFHYVENRLLAHLRDLPGSEPAHVVDLGCGVGGSLCHLAAGLPIRATGLTLSPVQVGHAERRIREAGLAHRVRCLEADYCEPPPDLQPADLAYAIESLVHGPDPARFFAACSRIVEFLDIYPTLASLCDLPLSDHLQGKSLTPLLREPTATWHDVAYTQVKRGALDGYSVRTDRWRYTEWIERATKKVLARQLYDHHNDPRENTNLAGRSEHAQTIRRLHKILHAA